MKNLSKRILLIGYNYAPEPTGIGKYSGEMIEWFAKQGYHCTVLTTYPYYPHWKVQEPYRKNRFWYKKERQIFNEGGEINIYRCPMYIPANPSGIKRMLADLSFFISAFFQLLVFVVFKKFELVITVVPSFQLGLLGIFYKKLRGGKLVYHIQDLQIEAAQDLEMIKSPQIIKFLFKIEKYILEKTDVISSISEAMVAKIEQKLTKSVFLFPNWTNTKFFYPIPNSEIDVIKKEFGFNPQDKIILYSGAIGEKQGLEIIIKTAKTFQNDSRFKFIICGTGPYKIKLQQLTEKENIKNVFFYPLQPLENFNAFLNMAHVHLVIQKAKAGDLVMPSKLTNILSVGGLALITASPGTGLYDVVFQNEMGILVRPEDQNAFKNGLVEAVEGNNYLVKENALQYAKTYLAIDTIMTRFEKAVVQ